jgi:VWFA-related protein
MEVIVTDKAGKPVSGLQQQDFTVLDNKRPAKILSFQARNESTPSSGDSTAIVLVVDEINTPFSRVANSRLEIKKFLSQNDGKLPHPITLAFATYLGMQMQNNPSSDGNSLIAMLDQHAATLRSNSKDGGGGANEDQVQASLKALNAIADKEQTMPGRKMVIWVSPGWPMLNVRRVDLSGNQANALFGALSYTSTSLRQAQITLYSVDPMGMSNVDVSRVASYRDFLKGVTGPNQVQPADLALQVFATQTGGQVIYGNSSIVEGLNHCIADLDSYYSLTIEAAPSDRPNTYHSLEIKMIPKGLQTRSQTGYYTQQ